MYGVDAKDPKSCKYNPDVGRIIASFHLDRIESILKEAEESGAKVLVGGSDKIDRENSYVCPTVIEKPNMSLKIMQEELFCPVLPIYSYDNFEKEVIGQLLRAGKPLAIYYFGNTSDQNYKDLYNKTSSGALVVNDIMTQVVAIECGFGGVGGSGCGRYGG
jgi:acyl-CoA reductase-like NAD-dependent aldehyde dehydrogenase